MVPVVVVLAAVCIACLVTLYVTHRMLAARQKVMAVVADRHARDLAATVSAAEERVKAEMIHRLGILAENIEGLADATRAVLMHQTVITAQQARDSAVRPGEVGGDGVGG